MIEKIKAHREPEEAAGEEDLWGIIGNSKADKDVKNALYNDLASHSTNGQMLKEKLQHKIEVAYMCSLMLQDITKHAESLRKERDKQEGVQEPELSLPPAARGVSSTRFPRVSICPNPIPKCANWDPSWFKLVVHYFSQLKWPDPREELQGFVSCLEWMLDLFLAYQTLGPVNITKIQGGKNILIPLEARRIVTNQRAYYHLPNYSQRTLLPNPLLTDCTHTWLRTLDLLKDSLCLPVERQNLFTLNLFGYNNVVPSLRARPTLLTGNRVSQYLSHLIAPGARCLKYPLKLPHARPWPLPSDFPDGNCV